MRCLIFSTSGSRASERGDQFSGVWERSPHCGPEAKPLVRWSEDEVPLKLTTFSYFRYTNFFTKFRLLWRACEHACVSINYNGQKGQSCRRHFHISDRVE